eukprot:m.2434 g.2434  ORF g.2434 m.2434 type:complete len:56 (-) comp1743_c0_seq1:74-241(-)
MMILAWTSCTHSHSNTDICHLLLHEQPPLRCAVLLSSLRLVDVLNSISLRLHFYF